MPYRYYYMSEAFVRTIIIVSIIVIILALAGSIVTYVLFLNRKNENRFHGFVGWLYDFLTFRKLTVEAINIVLYMFFTVLLTLASIFMLFYTPVPAILLLTFGNLILRIAYEFSIIKIITCKNTSDINKKLGLIVNSGNITGGNGDLHIEAEPPKPSNECPVCGKKLKPTAKFCPYCGSRKE